MKYIFPFFIFSIFLGSCGGPSSETDQDVVVEAIDSNYCDCGELTFDERYNHFYRFDRTDGFYGKCEIFHPNGQLKHEKYFENGKNHGFFIEYYNNGQVKIEKEFDMNFQVGEQLTYTKSGEVKLHVLYKRGKMMEILVNRPELVIDEE